MAYCIECGAEINDSANFCPECGTSKGETDTEDETKTKEVTEPTEATDSTSSVTFKTLIAWLGGSFILLWAIGALLISPIAGVLGLLTALFCFPPVRRKITDATDTEFSSGVVAVIVIVAFFLSIGAMGASVDTPNTEDPTTDPDTGGQSDPSTQSEGQSPDSSSGSGDQSDSFEQYNHEYGEPFIVGSGDNQIRYTVLDAYSMDTIGGQYFNEGADGIFVVVELRMENTGRTTYDITDRHLKLVDGQGRVYSADSAVSYYANQDSRIGAEAITYDQLQPGLSVERAVIFDVPIGNYTMMIEPTGWFSNDEPHFAAMGEIEYRG